VKEKVVIDIDLSSAAMSQFIADKVFGEIIHAVNSTGQGLCDITLRNVPLNPFPRLVVDYGDLYNALVEIARIRTVPYLEMEMSRK